MRTPLICCLLLVASSALAQRETYWIANRSSNNIMEVDACGEVVRAIDMGTGLRSAHLAPDGKVWVVRFIQSTIDIVDPTSPAPAITNVTFSQGSAFQITFDQGGNAWVSGGAGVEQFDPNGNSLQAIPLATAAPLGITVDADNNKWVAHRVTPGVLSRIDGMTGAVTTVNVASATMQPTQVLSDFRGLFQSSHIWVLGDSSSDVEEYDAAGVFQRSFTMTSTAISAMTMTADSGLNTTDAIWVGDFRTGDLHRIDVAAGTVSSTILGPSINGLATDSFGRLWASARISFSPGGPPCEVRRVDPANPAVIEHPGTLEIVQGGVTLAAAGTQSGLATLYHHALVVDPFGDADGDGLPNYPELQGGSSPSEAVSGARPTLVARGVTQLSGSAALDVVVGQGAVWFAALSEGLVAPGSGITFPGWIGEALLDPTLADPGVFSGVGPQVVPLTIPNQTALQGLVFFAQGFAAAPMGSPAFTSISCFSIW